MMLWQKFLSNIRIHKNTNFKKVKNGVGSKKIEDIYRKTMRDS